MIVKSADGVAEVKSLIPGYRRKQRGTLKASPGYVVDTSTLAVTGPTSLSGCQGYYFGLLRRIGDGFGFSSDSVES